MGYVQSCYQMLCKQLNKRWLFSVKENDKTSTVNTEEVCKTRQRTHIKMCPKYVDFHPL